jgi:hypothetical protein
MLGSNVDERSAIPVERRHGEAQRTDDGCPRLDTVAPNCLPYGRKSVDFRITKERFVNKLTACLIAATTLALPFAAYADDASYCAALSKAYREYAAPQSSANADATAAIAKCAAGDTAAGIPTLEKVLTDAKVTLPKKM